MSTVSPAELAARTRAKHNVRMDANLAAKFLEEWAASGIAEEVLPGRWQLSERGAAMFGGWAIGIELDDEDGLA